MPKKRRGNRRATSAGVVAHEPEPILAGLQTEADFDRSAGIAQEQDERDRWLKEQKPPHHSL